MSETGCAKVYKHEEIAVQMLNDKYQDEFEIERVMRQSLFDGYFTVMAYQVDNPDIPFIAMVNNDGTGGSDDYVSKLVCRELSDQVAKNLDELDGIYYIYSEMLYDAWGLSNPKMTLEQFMKEHSNMDFGIYLNYCPDRMDYDNFYSGICHLADGIDGLNGVLHLYICDENMLKRMQDYLENQDKMYDDYYSMTSPHFIGTFGISNGKLAVTKDEVVQLIREH